MKDSNAAGKFSTLLFPKICKLGSHKCYNSDQNCNNVVCWLGNQQRLASRYCHFTFESALFLALNCYNIFQVYIENIGEIYDHILVGTYRRWMKNSTKNDFFFKKDKGINKCNVKEKKRSKSSKKSNQGRLFQNLVGHGGHVISIYFHPKMWISTVLVITMIRLDRGMSIEVIAKSILRLVSLFSFLFRRW